MLTALFVALVLWATKGHVSTFFIFSPSSEIIMTYTHCTKLLLCWSALLFTVVVPIYYSASNHYTCGKPVMKTTAAYLSGNALAEWSCAVAACAFTAMTVVGIRTVTKSMHQIQIPRNRSTCSVTDHSAVLEQIEIGVKSRGKWWKIVFLGVAWGLVTLLLSIPSMLYAVSISLPGNNTVGLSGGASHYVSLSLSLSLNH